MKGRNRSVRLLIPARYYFLVMREKILHGPVETDWSDILVVLQKLPFVMPHFTCFFPRIISVNLQQVTFLQKETLFVLGSLFCFISSLFL